MSAVRDISAVTLCHQQRAAPALGGRSGAARRASPLIPGEGKKAGCQQRTHRVMYLRQMKNPRACARGLIGWVA
jgi:hypothetical protein